MDLTVFVLADSYRRAEEWILRNAVWPAPMTGVKPFRSSNSLVGEEDYIAIVLPSFYIRPDAQRILETVRQRAALVVKV